MFHLPFSLRFDRMTLESLYGACIFLLLIGAIVIDQDTASSFGIITKNQSTKISEKQAIHFTFSPYEVPQIEAKAYVVYDVVDKKVLFGKNEYQILPLASMTKLMTAVTASSLASTTKIVTISKNAIDGGYDLGLRNGQQFRLEELIKYMLIFSSNDAANSISENLGGTDFFVDAMNALARKQELITLLFTNPNGLDNETTYGGKGSPLDVAKLMAYAYKTIPEILDVTTKNKIAIHSSSGLLTGVPNTNQTVDSFVGILGSKTGFTDEAGGNLTVVFDLAVGRPVVIVVMNSTKTDRFSDVEKLYTFTKESLK